LDQFEKNISDEALINLLQEGKSRYFNILATRYEQQIFNKCLGYVKNKGTAADLSQDILIKIFLQLPGFRNESRFSTWLYTIIYHTCIDYLRKNKKNAHEVITEKLADEVIEIVDYDEGLPEEVTIDILNELLESITPEEKMLMLLKYKEKHHIKDIARTLETNESTIKMRLKRTRDKLNKLYAQRLGLKG